jgi:hypothetical protein
MNGVTRIKQNHITPKSHTTILQKSKKNGNGVTGKTLEIERLMIKLSKTSDPIEIAQLRKKSEELERHS